MENKYTKWYYNIIDFAKTKLRSKQLEYYEKHHIIPRSLGGKNVKENLVLLTPKEHYICHLLLTKMCSCSKNKHKMAWALHRLRNTKHEFYTSRAYSLVRKIHAKQVSLMLSDRRLSEYTKSQISKSNIGKSKIRTKEHNEKIGATQRGKPRKYFQKEGNPNYKGPILQLDKNGNIIQEYSGINEIINAGFTPDVYAVIRGIQKTHKGYYWKWKNQ